MARIASGLIIVLASLSLVARAANWPEFRGSTGQGLSTAKGLPVEWSTTKNVAWKTPIDGLGWSSPVVYEGKVYLTTAVPTAPGHPLEQSLAAVCLDVNSGEKLWELAVFEQDDSETSKIHGKNSHASATPITDGEHLFVHFGTKGTACLTLDGEVVWKTQELRYVPRHGNGGSPILVGDKLIVLCDGADVDFVAALDKSTGEILWKTDRTVDEDRKFSFSTGLAIELNGKTQVVCPGTERVQSYDPETGKELWSVDYPGGYSVIPRPVYGHGLVYVCSGYGKPRLFAIRPTGTGNVTETHVEWMNDRSMPHTPSPVLVGDELYAVSDRGIATCFDAKTGEVHWQERVGGNYSASPLYADGKVYFQSEQGEAVVIEASTTFKELARNKLEPRTFASYAVVDNALLIRTEENLYRIESK